MVSNKKNVYTGSGMSKADDPYKAGKEAVEMAIKKAGKAPTFGMIFCSGKYCQSEESIQKLVKGAHEAFTSKNKDCKLVGCTTAGELSNYGFSEKSCVALALASDYVSVGIGIGNNVSKNPVKAGEEGIRVALDDLKVDKYTSPYVRFLATKRKRPEELMKLNPYVVLVLSPGSAGQYAGLDSEIIKGIVNVTGAHIPILGGAAGDDFAFKQTYTFANGRTYKDDVIMVSMVLDVLSGFSVAHGYEPTGKLVTVTDSDGKIVKTLNNRPALDVYSELTGVALKDLEGVKPAWVGTDYPFGMVDIDGNYWIKSPQASIDKSLMFFATIPKNSVLALMKSNLNMTLDAGSKSLKEASQEEDIAAAIVFDCGGRKTFLKQNVPREQEIIRKTVKDAPFIGFYSYAEFGFSFRTPANICNETIVSFTISNKLLTE